MLSMTQSRRSRRSDHAGRTPPAAGPVHRRRAFSIAIPAWSAKVSTNAWSPALNSDGFLFVGQVQAPDDLTLEKLLHAQKRLHGRMVGREAVALRMRGDGRDPIGPILPDDQAQQTTAAREVADRLALLVS